MFGPQAADMQVNIIQYWIQQAQASRRVVRWGGWLRFDALALLKFFGSIFSHHISTG